MSIAYHSSMSQRATDPDATFDRRWIKLRNRHNDVLTEIHLKLHSSLQKKNVAVFKASDAKHTLKRNVKPNAKQAAAIEDWEDVSHHDAKATVTTYEFPAQKLVYLFPLTVGYKNPIQFVDVSLDLHKQPKQLNAAGYASNGLYINATGLLHGVYPYQLMAMPDAKDVKQNDAKAVAVKAAAQKQYFFTLIGEANAYVFSPDAAAVVPIVSAVSYEATQDRWRNRLEEIDSLGQKTQEFFRVKYSFDALL